jgi:tetratricopeptide (TPR) repeat protein
MLSQLSHTTKKRIVARWSFFLFFFLVTLLLFSQSIEQRGSKIYRDAHANLWTLELSKLPQRGLSDVEQAHLEVMQIFLEVFVRDNVDVYAEKLPHYNDAISRLKKHKGYLADYATAEAYFLRAMLRAKFNNNMKAGMDLYAGYRKAKSNYSAYPEAPPVVAMWGVMEAGLGSLPDQIQTYIGLVGFSGDMEAGINLINRAYQLSQKSGWEHTRNLLALASASIQVQLQNRSDIDLRSFDIDASTSPLLAAIEAKFFFDRNKALEAYQLLQRTRSKEMPFPYLSYLRGRIGVTLEIKEGADHLHAYLRANEGTSYTKSAHRYLWWHYFLRNDEARAEYHRKAIITAGEALTAPDQIALYESEDALNAHLLRARLLFDRGAVHESLSHLSSKKAVDVCTNEQEMGTYFYRMGRCLQVLGQSEAAIRRYQQAIKHFGEQESFERANALLQMATLYENASQCEKAKEAYRGVLFFKNYPFNEGQHQKAKAGLRRCK